MNTELTLENAPKYFAWQELIKAAEKAEEAWRECECDESIECCKHYLEFTSTDKDKEKAFDEYKNSDEPRIWTLRENGFDYDEFVGTEEEAFEEACDNLDSYNYQDGNIFKTQFHEVGIYCEDTEEYESKYVTLDPEEPECTDKEHDWQSPHHIVGGIKSNPGVWGHGAGVYITEVCMNCGCKKQTDTWATNPANGTQGHTTIEYEPGCYSDEI